MAQRIKIAAATALTAALVAAPLAAHAETVEYDIAVRDVSIQYPDGGDSVAAGGAITVSYEIANEGDVPVTAPGPGVMDTYVASVTIDGFTYGTTVSEDGKWLAEIWSHTPSTGSYELLSAVYTLTDGTPAEFDGVLAPGARWEIEFRAPVDPDADPGTHRNGVMVEVDGDLRIEDPNLPDGFFESRDTNPGNNIVVLPLVVAAPAIEEPAEEPATEEPAEEEPAEEEPVAEDPTAVDVTPFDIPVTHVYTELPEGAVIEVRADHLPAFNPDRFAVSDADRAALDAYCDDDGVVPPSVDLSCTDYLAHAKISARVDVAAANVAMREAAHRAIVDQMDRNKAADIPATAKDGVLRLVVDDRGFVTLPQGVVEGSITLPFTAGPGFETGAEWRSATFKLNARAAALSDAERVSDRANATGFDYWYDRDAIGGAGAAAFIEEVANPDGSVRWIGAWGLGPQLAVFASAVASHEEPTPTPVDPTPTPTPTHTPKPGSPTPVERSETGDGGAAVAAVAEPQTDPPLPFTVGGVATVLLAGIGALALRRRGGRA